MVNTNSQIPVFPWGYSWPAEDEPLALLDQLSRNPIWRGMNKVCNLSACDASLILHTRPLCMCSHWVTLSFPLLPLHHRSVSKRLHQTSQGLTLLPSYYSPAPLLSVPPFLPSPSPGKDMELLARRHTRHSSLRLINVFNLYKWVARAVAFTDVGVAHTPLSMWRGS